MIDRGGALGANPSDQHSPELRIFRDAVPIAAGMVVGSWVVDTPNCDRGHRYLNEKYSAALLVQTPHVPPGRLGKEGAVRSEMQITLDWVSPSQTSPARIAFPASSVSKQRDDLGEMHHSTKGRAGRGFLVLAIAVCVVLQQTHGVFSVSTAEN